MQASSSAWLLRLLVSELRNKVNMEWWNGNFMNFLKPCLNALSFKIKSLQLRLQSSNMQGCVVFFKLHKSGLLFLIWPVLFEQICILNKSYSNPCHNTSWIIQICRIELVYWICKVLVQKHFITVCSWLTAATYTSVQPQLCVCCTVILIFCSVPLMQVTLVKEKDNLCMFVPSHNFVKLFLKGYLVTFTLALV